MSKTKSSAVLGGTATSDALTKPRSKLGLVAIATAGAITVGAPGAFAITTDPLHGYCAGAGQCIDNGTNSPTSTNPPVNFGFTVSPGPASGSQYMVDILTPDNKTAGPSFTLTGPSGTATLFSATPFTSGFLDGYLGISASPANPIGGFLPATQALDPGATGFDVYAANLGAITLQGASNPNVSPLENITSGVLPQGSYIVAFLNEGTAASPDWVATALSGAIFDTAAPTPPPPPPPPPVPEPASLALLGSALAGLGLFGRRRKT